MMNEYVYDNINIFVLFSLFLHTSVAIDLIAE